jgi:tetratricopeptide (TPR) repeat protein
MKCSTPSSIPALFAACLLFLPTISQAWAEGDARTQSTAARGDATCVTTEAKPHMEDGQIMGQEKKLSGAIASYPKAASHDPNSAEAHFAMGEALARADRYQEALVRYTLAVAIAPRHKKALYGRSQLCLRMKLYAQARKDLSQLIELVPGVADYHYQRATTLMKMKSITEAYHDFLRAHELDKKYPRPSLIWKKNSGAMKVA